MLCNYLSHPALCLRITPGLIHLGIKGGKDPGDFTSRRIRVGIGPLVVCRG